MEAEHDAPGATGFSFAGLTGFLGRPDAGPATPLAPGSRIGDVTIVRLLGEGGMGRVYEGRQGMPCRTVAVKVMHASMLSAAAARRFDHEAHLLGRLNHAGIARIYSAGMEQGPDGVVPYFVMEHVEDARPITAYAAERDLSARDRVSLFREVCQAVAHGHQKGVIHRDLKPGNILVDASGHAKVIDFGVARSTDGDVSLTTLHTDVGQIIGTLQYMSPEQFAGSSDDLDVRADVYSLGVVLYELLAGRPPYDVARKPIYEAARVVRETEPAAVSTVNPRLRGDLTTIVATCLEKERARRYSSAAELEADLGRYLRGEPIAASRPGLLDAVARLARRHKAATLAAAGVLAALLAGLVGISIFAVRAERERAVAVRERERADAAGREAVDQLYVANLRTMRASVGTGNQLLARRVYRRTLELVGEAPPLEMRLLGADLDDALVVLDTGGPPVTGIAYSPDGGVIATSLFWAGTDPAVDAAFANTALKRLGLASPGVVTAMLFFAVDGLHRHTPRPACDDGWVTRWRADIRGGVAVESQAAMATSPADGRTARLGADGQVHLVDPAGVLTEVVLPDHRGRVVRATFNADGTRIAVGDGGGRVRLWDAASGASIPVSDASDGKVEWFQFSPEGSRLVMAKRSVNRETEIVVYDARSGRHLLTVESPRIAMESALPLFAFSADGGRLVTSSPAHDLQVWETSSGELLGTLPGHAAEVTAVAFAPEGAELASGAANGQLRLWNVDSFSAEHELPGHDGAIQSIAFRPGGETLASGANDGTVRVWSRTLREPLAVLPGLRGMTAVAYSPDGRFVAVAPRGAGAVELWNPRTVERVRAMTGSGGAVTQVAFSPDGTLVAAAVPGAADAHEVRIWAADSGMPLATLVATGPGRLSMAFSADGSRMLTTCGDSMVMVWDPRTGRRCMTVSTAYKGTIVDANAVFGLDGSRFAYATRDLHDTATGETVGKLPPMGLATRQAASPDGRTLATGVAFGTVYLSDFATGRRLPILSGHAAPVRAIAFSPDGSRLVTGALDGTAILWDVATGDEVCRFVGHEGSVETVILSPDGRRLVTGATDGTARIWDVKRGHELLALPNQAQWPTAIALSSDGTCLVTAASDGPVRIWGLSNADVVRSRQAVTGRP